MNVWGDLKSSCHRYLPWELTMFRVKKDFVKYNMILSSALHLAVHISSKSNFNLVQVLVQDLLLQGLLRVTASLEDVRRC